MFDAKIIYSVNTGVYLFSHNGYNHIQNDIDLLIQVF